MAFAEKNAVVAELFGALGAAVNLVDVFDAAVEAVQAEFYLGIRQWAFVSIKNINRREHRERKVGDTPTTIYGLKATKPHPVAHGTTGS
jgi:hypothetical protein